MVVITSTDDTYVEAVPAIAAAIKAASASVTVIVAGAATDAAEAWKAAGVDEYVNVRVNTYQLLKKLQVKMGVSA